MEKDTTLTSKSVQSEKSTLILREKSIDFFLLVHNLLQITCADKQYFLCV